MRAQRSHPESLCGNSLDCFAALATTLMRGCLWFTDRVRLAPLPVGQNTPPILPPRLSIPNRQNIPLYRNSDLPYKRNTLARDKGRIAIVTSCGPGCDGRDGVGREQHCRAGHREQSALRAYDPAPTASSHGFGGEHTPPLGFPARTCADGQVVWS
uniref:Uncharacterized protein n=1 Tax=Bradyrhizobium amphicarpaeae TaxID=1404768 RepID=A0A2U8PRD3_9BRAD|nr:hypothetical protein CIT40_10260 [Bradyrhizobium amphicarpaeae]